MSQEHSASILFAAIDDDEAPGSQAHQENASITTPTVCLPTPFPTVPRPPLTYCDFTASSPPLPQIENAIASLTPLYANTHTTASYGGATSTSLREEARRLVAEATGAKYGYGRGGYREEDCVLFCGEGSTRGLQVFVEAVGKGVIGGPQSMPVGTIAVFTSEVEHHSNLLPWRESPHVSSVSTLDRDADGSVVDVKKLEKTLTKKKYSGDNVVRVVSVSLASNVTGQLTNVSAIVKTIKRLNDALPGNSPRIELVVDGATGFPYVDFKMCETISAFVFSGHKCAGGGGGTPGVLIVKKRVLEGLLDANTKRDKQLQPTPPSGGGGGTVFYVTENSHRYLTRKVERFEGGTPAIVASWRLGLCMILRRSKLDFPGEEEANRIVSDVLSSTPSIVTLGSQYHSASKLPIFPFLVRCGSRFLHYNFICSLLSDLFGIQTRGGCVCSGPFSQKLLGIDAAGNSEVENSLLAKWEVLRPGFTRFSTPASMRTLERDYILRAIKWVGEFGWAMLVLYRVDHRTGDWRHNLRRGRPLGSERKWLSKIDLSCQSNSVDDIGRTLSDEELATIHENVFKSAETILDDIWNDTGAVVSRACAASADEGIDGKFEHLRWFVYGSEVAEIIRERRRSGADDRTTLISKDINGIVKPPDCVKGGRETTSARRDPNGVFPFMQAEGHQGEASVAEIREGYKDGEIDDECIVFMDNDWVPIAEFLEEFDDESVSPPALVPPPTPASTPPPTPAPLTPTAPAPSSNQMKKKLQPPKKLLKSVSQAILQWNMIENGDRLLLGLSGGKDSLTLLHCLLAIKKKAPVNFTIACCTIDPLTPSFDPSPLIPYVESLGIEYHYIRSNIVEKAATAGKDGGEVDSLCAFCARLKRGSLYSCAREHKYNKLVLAQHLDDICESFLMSIFNNGLCRTMKANYEVDEGGLNVIRPLVYARESQCRDFAKQANLPVINENCPACFEEPKERARVKKLLSKEEGLNSSIFDNMRRALTSTMHQDFVPVVRALETEVRERGRKENRVRYTHDENNNIVADDRDWTPTANNKNRKDASGNPVEEKKEVSVGLISEYSDAELAAEVERRRLEKLLASSKKASGPVCSGGKCEIFE